MSDEHQLQRRTKTCDASQSCEMTDRAADKAVRKVFAIVGVDIDKPESVAEFQEDLRFGKKLRRVADHSLLALVALVVAGFGAALWAGVLSLVHKGH